MNFFHTSRVAVKILTLTFFLLLSIATLKAQYVYDGINPAHLLTSWTGSPPNFNSGTFTINSGQTAQVSGAMTLGAGATLDVLSGGRLVVTNSVTFTNNGTLNIAGGGTLELQGSGAVTGTAVTYQATNSLLLYSGVASKTTNGTELPPTMPGSVTFTNTGVFSFGNSTDVQGTFTVNAGVNLRCPTAQTLSLSGPIVFNGAFLGITGLSLVIQGSGTITGTVNTGGGLFVNLTVNRPGAVIPTSAMYLSGTLTLTDGVVRPSGIVKMYSSAAGAVVVGSGYVDSQSGGNLERELAAGATGVDYIFPVGHGTQYLPFTLKAPFTTSGGSGYNLNVRAFNTGSGGNPDCSTITSLSTTEYWFTSFSGSAFPVLTGGVALTAPSVVAGSIAATATPTTFSAVPGGSVVGGSTVTANGTPLNFGTAVRNFTVASNAAPTVYTFTGGNPNALANWSGSPPSFAVPCAEYVIPNGQTATLTANLAIGSGSSGSKLIVQSGGTLNTTTWNLQIAGNGGALTIQDGATLQVTGTAGVNGTTNNSGALQITAVTPATVTFTIGSAVNYIFSPAAGMNTNFGAAGVKPAISNIANLTIAGSVVTTLNSDLTLSGNLTMSSGGLTLNAAAPSNFILNGAANVISGGVLTINANFTVQNPNVGGLSVNGGGVTVNGATGTFVTGQPFVYAVGTTLTYSGTTALTAGLEFPAVMPGNVVVNLTGGTPTVTLNAARTLGASSTLTLTAGRLVTSAANMLTVNNTVVAAVARTNGMVEGPMQRALPTGAGTWLFPVSKGGTYLPFAVQNPTTAGGATIQAEVFNTASGGTSDGTTILNPLGGEYWQASAVAGSFTSGLIQVGKTGVAAENIIGSSTTLAGTYTSNGANTFSAGTPPTLTRTVTDNLAAPTYFVVGSLPSTYYYISGSPYTASNWNSLVGGGGVPAISLSGQNWTYIIPNGRTVTVTGVDLIIGSGASASQAIVQAGGTLDVDNGIGFAIGGNGGAFTLQAGATLRARGGAGINGTTNNTGAIQIFAGTPGTVTVTYDPAANYIFSRIGGGPARTAAAGAKPAVTFANNVLVDATGPVTLDLGLTVNGNLTINAAPATAGLTLAGATPQVLTLNGAANQIQAGQLTIGANFTVANPNVNGLTVLSGANVNVGNATAPFVTGNEFVYNAGSTLTYQNTTPVTTGLEFPSSMNGNVVVNATGGTPTVTLNAARTLGASSTLTLTAGRLVTSGANMLTVNNTATAAVNRTNGMVEGPMRRAIPAGGPTAGTWLFPVSKGATYLPFALVDPTSVGGSVVQAETFNTNPMGTADGTTIQTGTVSTTEYWESSVFSGGAVTARMLLGRTALAATQTVGSAAAIGGPYSAPSLTTYNNLAVDNLTQNTAQTLSSPNFFAVGTIAAPTTYYYFSGNPNTAASWWSNIGGTGTQAANFTTSGWTFIVPNGYTTAAATANIPLSAGVTLQVAGGGTLNMAGFALTGAGNFDLQANGTLQISRTDGVNGNSAATGAIQLTGTVSYAATANYILNVPGAVSNANFEAVGVKPLIANAQNLTITGNQFITLATGLALSGALTVNCASANAGLNLVGLSAQTLALNGPGSVIQSGVLGVGNNFTLANNNGVTPLSLAGSGSAILRTMATALPLPIISGNPVNYASSSYLEYLDAVTGTRNTGAELPPIMNGAVMIAAGAGSVFILSAPSTLNATINFGADGRIVSTPTNLLTIGNTSPTAILGASATRCITGVLARAVTPGTNTYSFPLGGGTAATYIPVTFAYTSAPASTVVTIEGFNTAAPGTPGTGITALSTTEYWRVNPSMPVNAATLTFTRVPATTGFVLGSSGTGGGTYNGLATTVPTATTIRNTTPFAPLAAGDNFYAIGTATTTYYYVSGDPNVASSWNSTIGGGGLAAANFTTSGWTFIVPNGYTTAAATANIALSAGVTLQVAAGGTLNTSTFALTGAGNFDLQAGGTLQTANLAGVNGTSAATGTIQVTGTITYSPTASYILSAASAAVANFAAVAPNKPAIAQAQNLTRTGGGMTALSTGLALSGVLTINTSVGSGLRLLGASAGQVFTLDGPGSQIIQGTLELNTNFTLANNNATTPLAVGATGQFFVGNPEATVNFVTGQPISYVAGAILAYIGNTPLTTGLELPSTMAGSIAMSSTPMGVLVVTLGAPTTLNGILNFNMGGGYLQTSPTNLLTIANTAPAAISGTLSGTAHVRGPLARAIQPGGGTYQFPVGGGSAATYTPVALAYASAPVSTVVTVEPFNVACPGAAGTGITGLSTTEYWRVNASMPVNAATLTFTRVPATTGFILGSSGTGGGTYNGLATTVPTATTIRNTTAFAPLAAGDSFYAIGTATTTYYYESGNPSLVGSWGTTPGVGLGTTPTNFTSAGSIFVIESGSTAALTANLTFGTGTNAVTLTVQSGATLNTGAFSVIFEGNNSVFNLQNGATFMTRNTNGINGIANVSGAVQITAGLPGTVTINYGTAVNFIFGAAGGTHSMNIGAVGNKPALTQMANLSATNSVGQNWILGNSLTVNGSLLIQTGGLQLLGSVPSVLTLNGSSLIDLNTRLTVNNNFQVVNNGVFTVSAGASILLANVSMFPTFSGMPVTYLVNSEVRYVGTPTMSTGAELPAVMNGNVFFQFAPQTLTLSAATTMNGVVDFSGGAVATSPATMLTIANTAVGAVTSSGGYVQGPMRRTLPTGAGIGVWLFPVGKGGNYYPFAITSPNTAGGATVEVEAFNVNSGGSADGVTLLPGSLSPTEYWQANVVAGSFTSGLMRVGSTGITASNILGSSTTLAGVYASNGANTYAGGTPPTLTRTVTDNLAALTYFAVGANAPIFYYQAGDPNTPANWNTLLGGGGTAAVAGDFTSVGRTFVVPNGRTATLTNNLVFGSGANNVTFTVQLGGTLNTGIFAVQFAGNNSVFNLQNGATLQTSHASGINGIGNNDGAVQITPPATGVVISYGPTANYVLGTIGATTDARFADFSGNKQAITQAASLTVNPGALRTWILSGGPLTLSGALTVQSGTLALGSSILTFGGAGSIVQNAAALQLNSGAQIVNTGGLTIQSGGRFEVTGVTTLPIVATNPITYDVGSFLSYFSHPVLSTGLEFPASMNGSVSIQTGGPLTLNGAKSVNGTFSISGTGALITDNTNMLTIANTADVAVVRSGSGEVRGPMRRALPAGASPGLQWLFPVSKGGTYLPFAVNSPTTAGGATIEVEAYNAAPAGGSADGTTIIGALGAEHWRAEVAGGTFTSGFLQTARAGLTAANLLGSSTTAPPTATTYSSNGANTLGTLTAVSSLTRTVADNLAAPTYVAVGTAIPTFYYKGAPLDATLPTSWNTLLSGLGTDATAGDFSAANTVFIVPSGRIATLITGNLNLGVNVTLQVQSGGSLNTATFAITGAGNFDLQAGSTLQANNTTGFNGGAIQNTGTRNWSFAANYIFQPAPPVGVERDINIATAQVNNLTTIVGGAARINGNLQVNGVLSAASRITMCGSTFTLAGAGPHSLTAELWVGGGNFVVNAGSTLNVTGTATVQLVGTAGCGMSGSITGTGTISYAPGTFLVYGGGWTGTSSQPSLPTAMGGGIWMAGATVTLGAATTVNSLLMGGGNITTSAVNMLTLGNATAGALTYFGGSIEGPLRRAIPAGASVGQQWLFPVGKGGTYLPFAVNDPTTAGGATIEVEAYNTAPAGGTTDGTTITGALGTQYWRAEVAGGTFTSGLMQAAVTGLTATNILGSSTIAPPAATTYSSNGTNTLGTLTAVSSLARTVADNIAAPTYFAVGSVLSIYYYNAGDAATPGNWWTGIGGTGTPATNFTTPGTTFIVEPTHTPATALTSFTLGANVTMNVQNNATLEIASGTTLTNNSTLLNIQAGGTLRILGNGAVSTTPVNYLAATSTLEYAGAGLKTSSTIELPLVMPGSLIINKTAPIPTLALGSNTQINGTLTAQAGSFDISGRTLQANGAIVFSGGSINASATATLDIAGTGTITGSALFTGIMGSLSMNRAAETLVLGSPLDISAAGLLTLNQGFIQTTPTNILRTTNSAPGAIAGTFGANSHVMGPLRRALAAAGTYSFPVGGGTAATYNPATLTYTAGGGTVEVEPLFTAPPSVLTSGLMGSLGSASEYWRVTPSVALSNADLTFQRVPGMTNGVNLLGVAPTANGTYNGYTSTVAGSTIVNTTTFPTLAAGNGFYAVGTGVTTFYYRGGGFDPNIAGNWYTGLGGTGSPAPSFIGANYTFIVPNGTTAALTGNFTVANTVLLQVATGGVLDVDGFQVMGMGNFDLQNGATLQASNNNGFNGGAIVNTGTRTWSPAANYVFTPTVGPDVNINIATATVNNLATQGAGATRINANLQVNGVLTGNGRITNCTATLTLGAGTHTLTREMWFANTSVLTVNGTLNVSTPSGAITLIGNGGCGPGSGVVNGSGQVNYAVGSSLNAGSNWIGTIAQVALPAIMDGNVSMSNGVQATLGAGVSSQINGTFSLNGSSRLNIGAGNTLTLNDAITLGVGSTFGGTATSNLSVTGTGAITGALAFTGGAQTLNNFTLNRAGANPALGSPLTVAGTLALTNGVITNTLANMLTVSNTAPGAVAAGSGYVDGFLERAFGAAGAYTFPVGQGAQTLPMTFSDDGTGTGTLIVNAQAGGGGVLGTAITSLYNTGRWELRNSIIGTRTGTVAVTPSAAVPAVSVIGVSTTGIGGTYNSIGPALFLGGASIAQTLPQNFTNTSSFLATGSAIPLSTRYYFISGDASNPASWNSLPNGTGTVAPSFLIPGVTFYVMGNVSGISTTVATVQSSITLGAGAEIVVETPSVLGIADGVTLTNNGTVTVRGTTTTGATLLLDGTGALTGTVVSYGSALARVQYSGSGTTRPTSPTEFPNSMDATVVVDENVTVVLDDHKTLSSALVLGGLVDIRNRSLSLRGRLDLRGAFIANGQSDVLIGMNGAVSEPVSGALRIATNVLRNFTLDRRGAVVPLGSPLLIQNGLSLARGVLRSDTTNYPIMVNTSFGAVQGGNDSSFVEGPLERYFPTNRQTATTDRWLFPVGRGARYLPFTLVDPRTGGDAPLLRVEAFGGSPGGTVDGTLSSAGQGEYWNVALRAGNHTQSRAELGRFGSFAQAIPLGSVVAKSPTQSGVYTSIGGAVAGFAIQSGTFATFSTFTIGSPFSLIPASQQPTLTSFGPVVGTSATRVLVEGTNLGGLSSVLVGGVPVSFTVVSPTQITLVLNPGVQSGPITLTTSTSGSATSFQPFTFIGPPTMATVSPQYFGVGQDIIINGNNFYGTPTLGELYLPVVRIGGITASNVEIISPTQMRVRFPVATTGNLTVQSWGGIATTASVVGVLPAPRVVSLSPSTAGAGETVTVTGEEFRLIGSISIGGIPVTEYVVSSSTGITLRVPPGATTGTIRIQGSGGSTTSTQQLTIIPPPVITSFTPVGGSAGQIVTLTGTNFTDATSVRFGGTSATFTVSADGRTIQAIIPAGVVTGATISVTTRGGTATTRTGFVGTPAPDPTITGFEPVPVVEGGLLTVRGVNFPYNPNNPLANVILGGVAVPGAFYTSSTTVVFRVPQGVVPVTMLSTQAIITLQTPRGATSASLQVPIRAADAPVITGFSPEEGDSITTITIEGRNFGSSPRTTILDITIGGVPVQSFVVVNSRVIVSVAGTITSGAIVIRTPSGTVTTTATFRYTGTPVGGVSPQDSVALLRLYSGLGGPGWTDRTNWGRGFVGSWYGVTVENGRVTELRLGTNNVRGALSAPAVDSALAQLNGLRVLDLSNNGLVGTLPRNIGKLTLLETLNLSKNKLTGGLQDLCGLVRLRDLDVSDNGLRDSLSGVLCCLISLERANVSNNRIYGRVPLCLLDLERLSVLDASGNELTDSLPPELWAMRSLTVLRLRRNRLTGSLPAAWGSADGGTTRVVKGIARTTALVTGLQTLDLGANSITGGIPASWGNLTMLRILALDSNRLGGVVPEEISGLGRLTTLLLGSNRFTDVPDLSRIGRLTTLGLDDNAFEFGPLEPHRFIGTRTGETFRYTPQAEVGPLVERSLPLDAPWRLTLTVSGTNNRYEWQKRQSDSSWKTFVPATMSSTSATLTFATFGSSDAGVYRCVVTNPYLPGLRLISRTQTLWEVPSVRAPEVPILLEPASGESGVPLRPVLVITASEGAAAYDLQLSTRADFSVVASAQSVPQTVEALDRGAVEVLSATTLERSTRYYWRALARNSFGASAWSTAGTFTTAEKDIAFTARMVEFGRVPRLDTGYGIVRLRNVADGEAVLIGVQSAGSTDSVAFVIDRSATVVGGVRFAQGEVKEFPVQFTPSAVRRFGSGIGFTYSVNGRRDAWTQAGRLRGTGGALKLVVPALDTMLVGLPRVAAALLINRGEGALEVLQTRLTADGRGAFTLKGATTFTMGAGDTTAVVVRCVATVPGAIPTAIVEAAGLYTTTASAVLGGASVGVAAGAPAGAVRDTVIRDTAWVDIRSFARRRLPSDLVARIAARPVGNANNLPPGTTVPMELYLESGSTGRDTLQRLASPFISGSARYGNQVLTLAPRENAWRRVRNTNPKNRSERAILPETALGRTNSDALTQFSVQVVAGETDTTRVEIEDMRWLGVYLIEYGTSDVVRARVSQAGGKRLIGAQAQPAPTIVAIAPNPAREEIEVRYTLPEASGAVEVVIVDVRGTEVLSMVRGEAKEAGEYTLRGALTTLPSGNYTLRLTANNRTATAALTVVR